MEASVIAELPESIRGRSAKPNELAPLAAAMIKDSKPRRLACETEDEAKTVVRLLRRAVNAENFSLLVRKVEGEANVLYVGLTAKITRTRKPKTA